MSIGGIPAVAIAPPSIAPKQWRTIFDIGISSAPKVALASSTSFAYAAYALSKQLPSSSKISASNPVYLMSAAAVTTVLIVPWTILMMLPTNDLLDAKVAAAEAKADIKEDSELTDLLKKWAGLNGIRSVFPLIAAISGLWAITS